MGSTILALGASIGEHKLPATLFLYGFGCSAATVAVSISQQKSILYGIISAVSFGYFPGLIFAVCLLALRRRALLRARCLIDPDRAQYEAEWSDLISGSADDLSRLVRAASFIRARITANPISSVPRQCNRLQRSGDSGSAGPASTWGIPGTVDPETPVHSLHQLYCQAVCVHPVCVLVALLLYRLYFCLDIRACNE